MIRSKIVGIFLCTLPAAVTFVELIVLFPFKHRLPKLLKDAKAALSVIRSSEITEQMKEKRLLRYSMDIMQSSLLMTFYLLLLLFAFVLVYCLFGFLFIGNLQETVNSFGQIEMPIVATVVGTLYVFLRVKINASKKTNQTDYTFFSRSLHYMALNNSSIKEVAYYLDCIVAKPHINPPQALSPVFVAGLARAGTTILLEALYSTGEFTTLTYRDMPFVTAPFIWSKIPKRSNFNPGVKKERAHGDGLYVNYNSPEAFEEVFWMTLLNKSYIKDTFLELHHVNAKQLGKYNTFMRNVIARKGTDSSLRYLAKNNNNLIRIDAIKSVSDNLAIIIPFRNPIDHAMSLCTQHQRMLKIHAEDSFSLKYMNWLGHFEFGLNFKPFRVCREALPTSNEEPKKLDYWIRYWTCVYEYVIEHYASDAIFLTMTTFVIDQRFVLLNYRMNFR